MSKSVPATPDYVGAAQQTAQASANTTQSQTYANRPDINTPWSQQTWSQTPTWDPTTGTYVNQWTQNTNLVPQAQSALDSQLGVAQSQSDTANKLSKQGASALTAPLDWSKFTPTGATPQAQTYGTPDAYANKAADAAYQEYTNRNQPLQQTALTNLDTQLQNQGLKPGDAAYDTAIKNLRNQQSDANTQADLGATQFGVQGGQTMQQEALAAGGQTYGQQLSSANYQDQLRQQQISEDLQKRGYTTNEINSILTGQQVQTGPSPQFNAAGASQPTNYSTAAQSAYSGDLNAANIQNAGTSNALGTAAGVAAAFF